MMRVSILCFLLLLLASGSAVANASAEGNAAAESEIRATRERFNKAIEQQDIDAINPVFAPNYHIVTGRSAQFHGAESEYKNWQQLFRDDPTFICRRETREIRTNVEWGLAEELGDWTCNYTVDGKAAKSSGVYAAKWQRSEGGAWLLQSEVFTTITCDGSDSGCQRPEPF